MVTVAAFMSCTAPLSTAAPEARVVRRHPVHSHVFDETVVLLNDVV
jgi:hypothetical protein